MLQDNFLIQPQQVMIECIITPSGGSSQATNPFNEQDFLIGRPIIGIQVFSASDMANSPLGSNLPVLPDAAFKYAFMNISRSGQMGIKAGIWYKNLPLISLRHSINYGINLSFNIDMFRCDPMVIQWRDSNVSFPTPVGLAGTYSVPLLITYLLENQDATPYRMAWPVRK